MRAKNDSIDLFKGIKIYSRFHELFKWNQLLNNDKMIYYKNCKKCKEIEIKNRHIIYCIECRKQLNNELEVNKEVEKL